MKKKIEAKITTDSIDPRGNRIVTYLATFPRFILPELATHRMFSKNSASSRAIPFNKMVKMVTEDPFIPIAWQKNHKGMQGTEYVSSTKKFELSEFLMHLTSTLDEYTQNLKEYSVKKRELGELFDIFDNLLRPHEGISKTLPEWWLFAKDKAVEAASILYIFGITKQLCNRLLEPFMWHTVLLTATEFENFFNLRLPIYEIDLDNLEELK